QVVALDAVADVLQDVAQDERPDAPVPLLPRQGEQQHHAGDCEGNAEQVDPEVEGMAMPLQPVAQGATEGTAGGRRRVHERESRVLRCVSCGYRTAGRVGGQPSWMP